MLIARCLCGEESGSVEIHNGLEAVRCRCGVARLLSGYDTEQYDSGNYHASSDRHPGCVPYAQRYQKDYRVAELRVERYRSVINGRWKRWMRALDVGCANGAFVHYLRSIDCLAFGLDRNPSLPRWCIRGDVQSIRLPRGRFDLVTYHDVLEHIIDPAVELRRVRRLMSEFGVLIIDVPDVSVEQGSHHWKSEHVWYFNAGALRDLMQNTGLAVIHEDRPIPGKLVMYGMAA